MTTEPEAMIDRMRQELQRCHGVIDHLTDENTRLRCRLESLQQHQSFQHEALTRINQMIKEIAV